MQSANNLIRHFHRKKPLAFEHLVHVGLRNTGQPGETPLGGLPAANEHVKVSDEPPPEFAKVHTTPVSPIPMGNRGVLDLIIARLESGDCRV
jgi:hypothetical protein